MKAYLVCITVSIMMKLIFSKCPPEYYTTESKTLVCSNENLTSVPVGLDETLRYVDLSNNKIKKIDNEAFRRLRHIEVINLSNNELKIVSDNTFTELSYLQEVDMSFNYLNYLHINTFVEHLHMSKLFLKNTDIGLSIPLNDTFLRSMSLKYLDISFSEIISINSKTFVGLPNLEELNLEGNCIINFDMDSLVDLNNIKTIRFDCNECMTREHFSVCKRVKDRLIAWLASPLNYTSEIPITERIILYKIIAVLSMMTAIALCTTVAFYFSKRRKMKNNSTIRNQNPELEEIFRRPLPQPPTPNEGYEVPIVPYYMSSDGTLRRNWIIIPPKDMNNKGNCTEQKYANKNNKLYYNILHHFRSRSKQQMENKVNNLENVSLDENNCYKKLSSSNGRRDSSDQQLLRGQGYEISPGKKRKFCLRTPVILRRSCNNNIQTKIPENSKTYLMKSHDFKDRKTFEVENSTFLQTSSDHGSIQNKKDNLSLPEKLQVKVTTHRVKPYHYQQVVPVHLGDGDTQVAPRTTSSNRTVLNKMGKYSENSIYDKLVH